MFLDRIKEAYDKDPDLENLLFDDHFRCAVVDAQDAWRHVVVTAAQMGIPVPAFMSALSYYDGIRSNRLPANAIQAMRDNFGAHQYKHEDNPDGPAHSYELERPRRDHHGVQLRGAVRATGHSAALRPPPGAPEGVAFSGGFEIDPHSAPECGGNVHQRVGARSAKPGRGADR